MQAMSYLFPGLFLGVFPLLSVICYRGGIPQCYKAPVLSPVPLINTFQFYQSHLKVIQIHGGNDEEGEEGGGEGGRGENEGERG